MQEWIHEGYVIYREEDQWFMAGVKNKYGFEKVCFSSLMEQAYIFPNKEQAKEVWENLTAVCREDKIQVLPYCSLTPNDLLEFKLAAMEEQDMSMAKVIQVLPPIKAIPLTDEVDDEPLEIDTYVQEWILVYGEPRSDWKTVLQERGWQVQTKILRLKD